MRIIEQKYWAKVGLIGIMFILAGRGVMLDQTGLTEELYQWLVREPIDLVSQSSAVSEPMTPALLTEPTNKTQEYSIPWHQVLIVDPKLTLPASTYWTLLD